VFLIRWASLFELYQLRYITDGVLAQPNHRYPGRAAGVGVDQISGFLNLHVLHIRENLAPN